MQTSLPAIEVIKSLPGNAVLTHHSCLGTCGRMADEPLAKLAES